MIIVLDTETTGLEKPRVVEMAMGLIEDIASIDAMTVARGRFLPPVPIDVKAMSIHGITNEMVDGLDPFAGSPLYKSLEKLNTPDNVFVIHNAKFDLEVLRNEGIEPRARVVDTYKCCKKFFMEYPNVEMNLQFLKYYMKLYQEDVPEQIAKYAGAAHGAAADVVTLFLLFRRMVVKHTISELIEISANPVLYLKMPYGKHKGRPIQELIANDKGYTNWVYKNMEDEDILYSFKYWAKAAANPF